MGPRSVAQPPEGARGLGYELGLLRPWTPRPSRARALRAHKAAGRAEAAGAQGNEPASSLPSLRGTVTPATRSPGLERAPKVRVRRTLSPNLAYWRSWDLHEAIPGAGRVRAWGHLCATLLHGSSGPGSGRPLP